MAHPILHKRQGGGGRWGYWLLQTSLPHGRPCIWTPQLHWDPSSSRLLDISTQASTSNLPQHTGLARAPPFISGAPTSSCPNLPWILRAPRKESAHGASFNWRKAPMATKQVLRNAENRAEKPSFDQIHSLQRMEGRDREFGPDIHALLYLKQDHQGSPV